jgi:hypothetical protein
MRGDVLDGAEDPLLELDVLGNRLEDELASAKMLVGPAPDLPHPNQRYRRPELQVTHVAGVTGLFRRKFTDPKIHRFRFFDSAVRVGGN